MYVIYMNDTFLLSRLTVCVYSVSHLLALLEQKVSGSCCLSLWIQYNGASWSQVCRMQHPWRSETPLGAVELLMAEHSWIPISYIKYVVLLARRFLLWILC